MASAHHRDRASRHNEEKLFLVIVLALAALVGLGSWFAAGVWSQQGPAGGIAPDRPRQLADFLLTDSAGRIVTRAELNGKILAVSFLFTSCGLTCPEVSRRKSKS